MDQHRCVSNTSPSDRAAGPTSATAQQRIAALAGHLLFGGTGKSLAKGGGVLGKEKLLACPTLGSEDLQVIPLTPSLGAEVLGVDFSQDPLPRELKEALTELFHEHKVLFFRDQVKVDSQRQTRLVKELSDYWGIALEGCRSEQQEKTQKDGIFAHPFLPNKGPGKEHIWAVAQRSVQSIDAAKGREVPKLAGSSLSSVSPSSSSPAPASSAGDRQSRLKALMEYGSDGSGSWRRRGFGNAAAANVWHADNTFLIEPSSFTVLRAVRAPEIGGDTIFTDMSLAYEDLDEETKKHIETRQGESGWQKTWPGYVKMAEATGDWTKVQELEKDFPHPHHPVVRTHPVTKRKLIYVNPTFTHRLVPLPGGPTEEEDQKLLERLFRLANVPEYQCRFRWKNAGDMAIWDNRILQHYAVADHDGSERYMEHTSALGEKPF